MSDIRGPESSAQSSQNQGIRDTLADTAGSARQQAEKLYNGATGQVSDAWAATQAHALSKPFLTVASAAIVGAGLGWLLPSGRREKEVMAEVAQKVSDVARDAADTAVQVGRQQVDELTQDALASVGGAVVQAVMTGANSDAR